MSAHDSTPAAGSLAHVPVSLISTVMGLTGLAIAWQKAHFAFGISSAVWIGIAMLASAVFVSLVGLYAVKLVRFPDAVLAEWRHPVRVSFFPTISISLMLLAAVWGEVAPSVAFFLWATGAVLQLLFTLSILSSWMFHTHYDIKHANPAWFIPVVGNLFVPIGGARFASPELGWFFFSIGIVFWLVLMIIIFYRVFFHEPVPPRLQPTLFILLAPPAVGFIAYGVLVPELDTLARLLYYFALFIALLLGANAPRFVRGGFFISSWAYSFPLAAITIASFSMAQRSGLSFFLGLAGALLAVATTVIGLLAVKTVDAARRNAICVPE